VCVRVYCFREREFRPNTVVVVGRRAARLLNPFSIANCDCVRAAPPAYVSGLFVHAARRDAKRTPASRLSFVRPKSFNKLTKPDWASAEAQSGGPKLRRAEDCKQYRTKAIRDYRLAQMAHRCRLDTVRVRLAPRESSALAPSVLSHWNQFGDV
jgi:hypothetical protein